MPGIWMTRHELLDDDGRAGFLTHFLGAHHAFRRDAARFGLALRRLGAPPDAGRRPDVVALRGHWGDYRGALAHHHHLEDALLFPQLRDADPDAAITIDELTVQHRGLDHAIAAVDDALVELPSPEAIERSARELADLASALGPHLDLEERHLVPIMRATAVDLGQHDTQAPEDPGDPDESGHAFVLPWVADDLGHHVVAALVDEVPPAASGAFPRWQAAYTDRLSRWHW